MHCYQCKMINKTGDIYCLTDSTNIVRMASVCEAWRKIESDSSGLRTSSGPIRATNYDHVMYGTNIVVVGERPILRPKFKTSYHRTFEIFVMFEAIQLDLKLRILLAFAKDYQQINRRWMAQNP